MNAVIQNMSAINASRYYNISTKDKQKSAEKLASGYRINRSSDDAAGLKISEKMRGQIRGLNRGQKNIEEGVSWLQVADGAMQELHDIVNRIRELSVQASNDTNNVEDREAINDEIKQLRAEINRISLNTEFNNQKVFDNSYVSMAVEGTPDDLQVFNASYDSAGNIVTYGGVIWQGERFEWDEISAGMVTTDASGKQVFTGGEYDWRGLHLSCKAGDEAPNITRRINISADAGGINIDGTKIKWSDVKDEHDKPFSLDNAHAGSWTVNYAGAKIAFFVGSEINNYQDMANAINSVNFGKVTYEWKTLQTGTGHEQAVNASMVKDLRISSSLADKLMPPYSLRYHVRAGDGKNGTKDGVWIQDDQGNEIAGSFKSWADLGITSWNSGSDIQKDITYVYSDDEGVNDTLLSFRFTLSDVTSKDSVIDGLDNMAINGDNIRTNYTTNVQLDNGLTGNIKAVTSVVNNKVSFEEEKEMGRDFDQQTVDGVGDSNITYDKTNHVAGVTFQDAAGTSDVVSYVTDTAQNENQLKNDVKLLADIVIKQKQEAVLRGDDPDKLDFSTTTLTDIVGNGNITTSGHFDQVVTIDDSMKLTDGQGYYKPGQDGQDYPAAVIDFAGLAPFDLDRLVGLGFNSTCKTCSNHYSVQFTSGGGNKKTAENGYAYTFRKQGTNDYLLQIDIDSLKREGVNSAEQLAEAIVEIASEAYDFHYTQYAADGSKLWIYDNRSQSTGTTSATFDTAPRYALGTDIFTFDLKESTGDGRSISVNYTYNYENISDSIKVDMVADNNGTYVKDAVNNGYVKYDANNPAHAGMDRYNMEVSYSYTDADGTTVNDYQGVLDSYTTDAMKEMLEQTNVRLDAENYTYMDVSGEANLNLSDNVNVAVRAVFDTVLEESAYNEGFHIQCSGGYGIP